MWLPEKLLDLIVRDRSELETLRSESTALKVELKIAQANFDWAKVKINQLEFERAALLQRAHGIIVPVPEIATRQPTLPSNFEEMAKVLFEDPGDATAKEFGYHV